jgi:hypothetical protein
MAKKGVEEAQEQAWELLAGRDPKSVCERAAVAYAEESARYTVTSFGQDVQVDLASRTLSCESPLGSLMLGRLGYFSRIGILHYLLHAQSLPASGQWVAPGDLASGQLYFRGSHILPTEPLAKAYGDALERFRARGKALGGHALDYGDAAVRLLPLPRLPVALVLWRGDDEFPARASLLFDATCEGHVAADILWSTAMLSVLMFLS